MTSLVNSTKHLVGVKTHVSQTFPKNCREAANLFYKSSITLTPKPDKDIIQKKIKGQYC